MASVDVISESRNKAIAIKVFLMYLFKEFEGIKGSKGQGDCHQGLHTNAPPPTTTTVVVQMPLLLLLL